MVDIEVINQEGDIRDIGVTARTIDIGRQRAAQRLMRNIEKINQAGDIGDIGRRFGAVRITANIRDTLVGGQSDIVDIPAAEFIAAVGRTHRPA